MLAAFEHFAMRVQPGNSLTIVPRQMYFMDAVADNQRSRGGSQQFGHPFPGQRRDWADSAVARHGFDQVRTCVLVKYVLFVPRLDQRDRKALLGQHRIELEPQIGQDRFDRLGLHFRIGVRQIAYVNDQVR